MTADTKSVLEIEQITKRYRGSLALDGVSFTLEPGVFGLLGPNGAGKSTLIKALMGLVRINSGEERYREVQTYSTGMRQKQKLAQAIVHDPRLVLLDEPTSGLDPLGRKRMLKLIRGLYDRTGTSVVLSTHILHDVEAVCDFVVILGHGRLLVHDTMENLSGPARAGSRSTPTSCECTESRRPQPQVIRSPFFEGKL